MRTKIPIDGQTRKRKKFLFLPLYYRGTRYWLETVTIQEEYHNSGAHAWWSFHRVLPSEKDLKISAVVERLDGVK